MSETLIRKAKHGDADAFTALCAPLENMVYRHCLQLLGNPADAQDATQEAMLRAYRAMATFQGFSGVATWLYRIAHNVCLDFLKSPRTRRESASLEALQQTGFDPEDPNPTPEDAYLAQSERERLQSAVARLPDEQQALLSLRYGDGMSYDALAQTLGLNPGTVKSKLNRAKEKLKKLLPEPNAR
ncbi:MAG: RNA polymerase sigma factor [Eubacteriales bacterium]|nr:RNA polymerase sigma factor [Eubacteriales bacterium]